jgi:hypothetical protein
LVEIESGVALEAPRMTTPAIAPTAPIASTPMPTEEETSHNADAWDPCAQDPEISPDGLIWLTDPAFKGIRVRLRYRANPSHLDLEFLGVANGLVEVRDGMQRKFVPSSGLVAIPPTRNEDTVVSFSLGETYGKIYKIREFNSEFCVLRVYGQRPGRSEKNFKVMTRELAQINPPRK